MNQKLKGILLSILIIVVLSILSIVLGAVVAVTAENSWSGLGLAVILFIVTGIVAIVIFIVGLIRYRKYQSEFGLGLAYGSGGIIILSVLYPLIAGLINLVISMLTI